MILAPLHFSRGACRTAGVRDRWSMSPSLVQRWIFVSFLLIAGIARGQYWTEDSTFTPAIENVANQTGLLPVIAYPGGKLLTTWTIINGQVINGQKMVRLNSDGTLDSGFSGPADARVLAVYPDGRILVS